MSRRAFTEHHDPTGTMSNQQQQRIDLDRPHASTSVCDRATCRTAAARWVQSMTGEPATYLSFADARRRAGLRGDAAEELQAAIDARRTARARP